MVAINLIIVLTYLTEGMGSGSVMWVAISSIGVAISSTGTAITLFGDKLLFVFESKILIDYFDAIQDILVRCLSKLLLLVFSFQIFLFVLAYLVIFSMWKNWDETKVVVPQMWRPFESAALWLGTIITDPGKVIAYIFIVLLVQVFPSLIANITATALKGAKMS
jgi:hypothetical protein